MNSDINRLSLITSLLMIAFASLFLFVAVAQANPQKFCQNQKTYVRKAVEFRKDGKPDSVAKHKISHDASDKFAAKYDVDLIYALSLSRIKSHATEKIVNNFYNACLNNKISERFNKAGSPGANKRLHQ